MDRLGELVNDDDSRTMFSHGPTATLLEDVHEADEEALAKRGSNFGLPISLHLANLMQGTIGIAEVGSCPCLVPW